MPVKYVKPIRAGRAEGLLDRAYGQIRRDFGAVGDPFLAHSPDPELLAGVWAVERESVLCGSVPRAAKEAIASTISEINTCPYCASAHAMFTYAAGAGEVARALEAGNRERIADPRIRPLVEWASATLTPESEIVVNPPFDRDQAPEPIGTALAFHYINRVVNVLLEERLTPVPLGPLDGLVRRGAVLVFRHAVQAEREPGASLELLPDAELPDDLAWARPSPAVAGAVARLAAQAERAGEESLSPAVRERVESRVAAWRGEEPGLGRGWVEDAVAELAEDERPAGRLALLTALASYQVDDGIVEEFRRRSPADRQLVDAVAWAAFTAARRVTSWL